MATEVGAWVFIPRPQAARSGGRGLSYLTDSLSSWYYPALAPCSPGRSRSRLSLVRATSSWWVQSLVATIPSRPTLWVAVAWSWRVTSFEHLSGLGFRAEPI